MYFVIITTNNEFARTKIEGIKLIKALSFIDLSDRYLMHGNY